MRQQFDWAVRAFVPERVIPWFRYLLIWRRLSPPALFLASFLLLIGIGTLGLMVLPGLQKGEELGFIHSLFTMTSAVCVTGLVVVDTPAHFTFYGEAWLLLFIQLGGIGLISLTTLIIGAMGRRLSLRSEMLTMMPTHKGERPEVWQIAWRVAKFSLVAEAIGAGALFLIWIWRFDFVDTVWHAVFNSVSAYCNAGFSTLPGSLVTVSDSPLGLLVISLLVIVGGVGYLALEELTRWWKTSSAKRKGITLRITGAHRLSSHTWAVVVTTLALLITGFLLFVIFEWNDTLANMSFLDKLVNGWFMSVTPRTAGFNAIDYGAVGNDTATLTMLLMFIGGSPGSTAGGLKTTTIAVLVALGMSRFRGHRFVGLKDRAIPVGTIERTVGMMLLATFVLITSFFTISAIEASGVDAIASRNQFLPIAFETVSAFSTVGLSMNLTAELSKPSLVILASLMYIGRVGILSFFAAVTIRRATPSAFLRPAQEDVIVG